MDIERGRSTMHGALWIVQGLLAALFLVAGGAKLVLPLDQAHAPVVGILPFREPCLFQPIDGDTDRSRREPYLGPHRIDRQRPLVEQRFEHPEIRVAEACPAQVQALLRTNRQGAKRLPEHQPDMNPGRVLLFLHPCPTSTRLTIEFNYIVINVKSEGKTDA